MRKCISIFLCITLFITTNIFYSAASNTSDENVKSQSGLSRNPLLPDGYNLCEYLIHKGDVNGDGNISANDARLVLRAAANLETLNDHQKTMADVIIDGKITAGDARTILCLAASIDTYSSRIRVLTAENEIITLGPLTGNDEYCWYIESVAYISAPSIRENRTILYDNRFEQTFEISISGFFYGNLIYGSADGNKTLKKPPFEIDFK